MESQVYERINLALKVLAARYNVKAPRVSEAEIQKLRSYFEGQTRDLSIEQIASSVIESELAKQKAGRSKR